MACQLSSLELLKESPQWILIPRKKGNILFIIMLAATLVLSLVPFILFPALP